MLTPTQLQAVAAEGNVLVMAGAGTGKTRTLVERCVNRVMNGSCSLDEILMVTFTEAAAAEMRQRIRARLEEEFTRAPENTRLAEQLALLDTAHISTLHSFCLRLVREHFYELEIDPQVAVLDENEARLLADETLKALLDDCYAGTDAFAVAVQNLIQEQGRGWDQPIGELVLKLFHFTQTQPNPRGWLRDQLASFEQPELAHWRRWLDEALVDWREQWLPVLRAQPDENGNAHRCAAVLEQIYNPITRADAAAGLNEILKVDLAWPSRKKGVLREPFKDVFAEAAFLHSLVASSTTSLTENQDAGSVPPADPLAEDWSWVRGSMATLVRLVQEFEKHFAEAKRELGAIDFHDLEQFALRLLRDDATGVPTALALQWRARLRFVFVDEYQDINAAQDAILTALGRDGAEANRFLVGDVKQSIYRFRLADPRIFQSYARAWGDPASAAHVIPLTDNFRSREAILIFVNSLFASLMRVEAGGVNYDDAARLQFGNASERQPLTVASDATPRVELRLRIKGERDADASLEDDEATTPASEPIEVELEARWVAQRLRQLQAEPHLVWDDDERKLRPAEWRDMVVLLRSPTAKAEVYAKEFARAGVPLQVQRAGFYDSTEITDLVSLLTLLDNPLQDVPALAVLRSPLVGCSLDELALIRLSRRERSFWLALQHFHRMARTPDFAARISHDSTSEQQAALTKIAESLRPKIDTFLRRFFRWRQLARQSSLSHCLEAVLQETHYETWLLTQPRGEQRQANVERLLGLTRRFDQFHRHGLLRFLRFLDAQKAAEIDQEPAAVESENAVHLMSIHQSKGLEFPIVVVADLGKAFNVSDQRGEIILDEQFGLCPKVKPPGTEQRYPGLPHWLAGRRQKRETLGEELRLLYVALTRARDTLILTGATTRNKIEKLCAERGAREIALQEVTSANCVLDWLALWLARDAAFAGGASAGQVEAMRWEIEAADSGADSSTSTPDEMPASALMNLSVTPSKVEELRTRMLWRYPFAGATMEAAKTSVSILRRRLADETDDEARPARFASGERVARRGRASSGLNAAEIGTAHHRFQQFVELNQDDRLEFFASEAERLEQAGVLSVAEKAALDLQALADFWRSEIGRQIRGQAPNVQRELEFTARLAAEDLAPFGILLNEAELRGEFVVVQGVVDLAVILPGEIWLLDFKTDQITAGTVEEKIKLYRPQLLLYALALTQIYHRTISRTWLHFLSLGKTVVVD